MTRSRKIEYGVSFGTGINGPRIYASEVEARRAYEREKAVPSGFGGRHKRRLVLYKKTIVITILEEV